MRYGYARVSSTTQDHAAQVEALKTAGCGRIFSEKVSAKSIRGRHEFEKLRRAMQPGDTIVVTRLDRLARSSKDLHNIIDELQQAGCNFISLREAWCDTTTPAGRLMTTIMGGVNQFERELIRARCDEGIEKAKAKGVKFGRRAKLDHGQRRKIADRYAAGETMAELAREYDVGEATVWRVINPAS
jgi:DNA invertase Pin-like site-specific DNA recombinase